MITRKVNGLKFKQSIWIILLNKRFYVFLVLIFNIINKQNNFKTCVFLVHSIRSPPVLIFFSLMIRKRGLLLWLVVNPFFWFLKGSEILLDSFDFSNQDLVFKELSSEDADDGSLECADIDLDMFLDDTDTDVDYDTASPCISNTSTSTISCNNSVCPLTFKETDHRKDREKLIIQKLHEVFKEQFPKARYNLRRFYIENWPEEVDLLKTHWTKGDIDKINSRLPLFKFRVRKQVLDIIKQLGLDDLECLKNASLNKSLTYELAVLYILERFKEESEQPTATRIDWRLLDRRCIPDIYREVPVNSFTIRSPYVYHNSDIIYNIHFYPVLKKDSVVPNRKTCHTVNVVNEPADESVSINRVRRKGQSKRKLYQDQSRQRSKQLRIELQEFFMKKHPNCDFNMKKYKILNWPLEVNIFKRQWTSQEIALIRKKMNEFELALKLSEKEHNADNDQNVQYILKISANLKRLRMFLVILRRI